MSADSESGDTFHNPSTEEGHWKRRTAMSPGLPEPQNKEKGAIWVTRASRLSPTCFLPGKFVFLSNKLPLLLHPSANSFLVLEHKNLEVPAVATRPAVSGWGSWPQGQRSVLLSSQTFYSVHTQEKPHTHTADAGERRGRIRRRKGGVRRSRSLNTREKAGIYFTSSISTIGFLFPLINFLFDWFLKYFFNITFFIDSQGISRHAPQSHSLPSPSMSTPTLVTPPHRKK